MRCLYSTIRATPPLESSHAAHAHSSTIFSRPLSGKTRQCEAESKSDAIKSQQQGKRAQDHEKALTVATTRLLHLTPYHTTRAGGSTVTSSPRTIIPFSTSNSMSNSNLILAHPPSKCCTKAFKHTGIPTGKKIHIGGMDAYIAYPPEYVGGGSERARRVIFAFPDGFGTFFVNTTLLLDYFASHGFLVISPDYFRGESLLDHWEEGIGIFEKDGFDVEKWVEPHRVFAKSAVPGWIDAVKAELGSPETLYGCVGYCFGAPFVMDLLKTGGVSAGAFAHPAYLTKDDFRNIKGALFLGRSPSKTSLTRMASPAQQVPSSSPAPGTLSSLPQTNPCLNFRIESDVTFPTSSRHTAEDILASIHATYHVQLFSGVQHGFATKGNPDDPYECWVREESARGIVGWWSRFMKRRL
ncbi:hypothetical protein SISSUDRAFT_787519 [Sistotremastrum suecicum HHB10207 ss-3]|uniref:Dienelactone hydrolase domain-containing protein n=1 Tax=Sistotremastrum suecicum HHB10207 ss-3 TaxID=1314776 RepID=A0A166D0R1_9AGAM|nr:hypothetical protein SISSUDRAFT_787519 [Sistotremastrum suecicum HHB10207 ss-3]